MTKARLLTGNRGTSRSCVGIASAIPVALMPVVRAALYGDANLDDIVNLSDVVVAIEHWQASGQDAIWTRGDVNLDRTTNPSDIVTMIGNWQATPSESPGSLGDQATVPEPATLSLLALGGLAVVRRRLRRF